MSANKENGKKLEFLFKENNFAIPYRVLHSLVDMNKWIYMSILASVTGEFLIYEGNIQGLFVHLGNLLAIILLIIFGGLSLGIRNILKSLTLLSILRIIDFSMPQFFTGVNQYILICGVMFIPIYSVIKNQWPSKDVKKPICEKCRSEIKADDAIYCKYCGTKMERQQNFGIFFYMPIAILTITMILMVGQYVGISKNIQPVDIGGILASIFLIVCISISFMISNTKYWNKYNSNFLDMCIIPLLMIFSAIVIVKINTII